MPGAPLGWVLEVVQQEERLGVLKQEVQVLEVLKSNFAEKVLLMIYCN